MPILSLVRTASRLAAAVLVAATVAACGSIGDSDDFAPTTKSSKITKAHYPKKGDNKPHAGVARVHKLPIHGIDVSRYQGDIDWNAVRGAGTRFAFIKATEGVDYIDPNFKQNWRGAGAAGVPRSAYHFMYWCSPAAEQAAWFIRNVPRDPNGLAPVIDAEWVNHSKTCRRAPSKAQALKMVRTVSDILERHYGKLPIIYTDINFHRDVMVGEAFANPFWLRSTAAEPHHRYENRRWTIWQWTQTGTVPGIRGEVDRNAFYGSEKEWNRFLATGCDPRDETWLAPRSRCGSGRINREAAEPLVAAAEPEMLPAAAAPAATAPAIAPLPATAAAEPLPMPAAPIPTAAPVLPPVFAPAPVLVPTDPATTASISAPTDLSAFIEELQ